MPPPKCRSNINHGAHGTQQKKSSAQFEGKKKIDLKGIIKETILDTSPTHMRDVFNPS